METHSASEGETSASDVSANNRWLCSVIKYGNAVLVVGFSIYFLLIPFVLIVTDLCDDGLRSDQASRCAFRLFRSVTPKYERWARDRVERNAGESLGIENISGTEWPLFGSVFYLWAVESLQEQWDADHSMFDEAPKDYAAGAIEATAALITDPGHAGWVKQHWGEDYLHHQNLFYRMLLISGMTSYQKLTGNDQYESFLRDQVETLSAELDASPVGLLEDYPGQCYPIDVVTAIAAIRRADVVLGTDHSAFIKRSLRAFEDEMLHSTGLPSYMADVQTGRPYGRAPGCGISFLLSWTPEIWPEESDVWYGRYEEHFWQHRWGSVGFREFPKEVPERDWYMDVDAGPVVNGFGAAACGFGVGAARANGRFDHAYPLSAEMLIISWPLADGTLLGPRILSNATHAPYLGEAAILFSLTRMSGAKADVTTAGRLPGIVYLGLGMYLGFGVLLIVLAGRGVIRWSKRAGRYCVRFGRLQFAAWLVLMVGGVVTILFYHAAIGAMLVMAGQFLPRTRKISQEDKQDLVSG